MSNRAFLDIDETILTNKLLLPENQPQDVNLMKQLDTRPFFVVQPAPGICIKTKTEDGEKIFLNICTSSKIPAPEDVSDAELITILMEEDPQFVIPMSIGNERLEPDKNGSLCITYDVAINTTYFEKCQNNKKFLLFTISVIMDGVSNKFNKTLNTQDYVILKNRRVFGKLQQHRIENREPRPPIQVKKPLIEEIKSSKSSSIEKKDKPVIEEISSESSVKKSNYILLKQPANGAATKLIGLFDISTGISGKDIDVLVNNERIVINVERTGLTYDFTVPYTIDIAHTKCSLDSYLRILRVDMPIESVLDGIKTC